MEKFLEDEILYEYLYLENNTFIFLNVVPFQLDTLFSTMFDSFDTLFIVRTVELLEIVINRKLHLFIVDKSLTTEPFS